MSADVLHFPNSKLQCLRSIPVELILQGSLSWHKDSSFLTLTVMRSQYGKRRIMCSDILIWWFEEHLFPWWLGDTCIIHRLDMHAFLVLSGIWQFDLVGHLTNNLIGFQGWIGPTQIPPMLWMWNGTKWLKKAQSWRSFPCEIVSMLGCPCSHTPNEENDLMHLS